MVSRLRNRRLHRARRARAAELRGKSSAVPRSDRPTLGEYDELALDDLGPRVRVDYSPDGEHGREWLRGLVDDLADDGLVAIEERAGADEGRSADDGASEVVVSAAVSSRA